MQGPFSDFVAIGAPACSIIGCHLDLVVGPDDEVLQEQTGLVWVGDVFHLAIHWKPRQTVPGSTGSNRLTEVGRDRQTETAQAGKIIKILEHRFSEKKAEGGRVAMKEKPRRTVIKWLQKGR